MHALPRRRGADGLRGEAIGRPNRRGPRPALEPVGALVYSPPSRLRRRSAASRDRRLSRSSHAAYFALMRASSVLLGSLTSEWRDSNPRPRGPQPRALPTAPHSETVAILPRSRSPDGPKGGWRRRTPAGTRTRIDGFGDRRACHCTTDAKGGVHDAARLAARSSGRQASRTPPESPEPDSNRRPAAYEAAALPLDHRGLDGPSHRFFQCMMRVCSHGCLVRRATGGTVWWSRRDSNPRPSRCERDALPLRHGPMPVPAYARTGWKRSHSGGGVTPLVPSAGFEPATPTLGGWRSIP